MQIPRTSLNALDQSAISRSKSSIMQLWDALKGEISQLPDSYSEQFNFNFSDGDISLLSLLSRVDEINELSRDEFSEVVEHLIKVNPEDWPDPNGVVSIIYERLLEEPQVEFSEEEWYFSEDVDDSSFGKKVEEMLKTTIGMIYRDGVAAVVGKDGKRPNPGNNFLLQEDGSTFEGIFISHGSSKERKKFPFRIYEKKAGQYSIVY
jgi:hypothetical protein